ncbi:MAG: CDP-alcohol phosphatidyltransferase family protein [Steroidobacteraceae bacterium]|nr:CDP-alcohol phosphatidyltransferase family protein [Steroidobacteraceae bacterium]
MPRTLRTGESSGLERQLVAHLVVAALLGALGALAVAMLPAPAPDSASASMPAPGEAARLVGSGTAFLAAAGAGLLGGAALLFWLRGALRASHPHADFGAANRVTLARATLVVLLAAFAVAPGSAPLAWLAVALATLAASLDALDGPLARRHGLASHYGARFDMETDALLILVLALLAWRWDRAGAWVLASGLMRYAFVLAGHARPWLAGELAPSRRRQAICVVQVVGLVAVLAPWWPGAVAAGLAGLSLAALCYSFGVDVMYLARRRRSTAGVTA